MRKMIEAESRSGASAIAEQCANMHFFSPVVATAAAAHSACFETLARSVTAPTFLFFTTISRAFSHTLSFLQNFDPGEKAIILRRTEAVGDTRGLVGGFLPVRCLPLLLLLFVVFGRHKFFLRLKKKTMRK